MILRNKKGRERNFKVLLKLEENNKKYLVYEDMMSGKIYGGLQRDNTLQKIADEEIEEINKILERISG